MWVSWSAIRARFLRGRGIPPGSRADTSIHPLPYPFRQLSLDSPDSNCSGETCKFHPRYSSNEREWKYAFCKFSPNDWFSRWKKNFLLSFHFPIISPEIIKVLLPGEIGQKRITDADINVMSRPLPRWSIFHGWAGRTWIHPPHPPIGDNLDVMIF